MSASASAPLLVSFHHLTSPTRLPCLPQYPHRGVREKGFLPPNGHGVYISRWHHGSPAHRYGLFALHWITGGWVGGRVGRLGMRVRCLAEG